MLKAHVTPSVLAWGRTSAGYAVDEVAARMRQKRVTADVLRQWESGEEMPSYAQLKKLAKLYKRPIVAFLLPHPPEESWEGKLRALPDECYDDIPPSVRFIIRKAAVRQMDLAELLGDGMPAELRQISALKPDSMARPAIKSLAQAVRRLLGISVGEQQNWTSTERALEVWRGAVENHGIWVFKDNFGGKSHPKSDQYDGFFLPDNNYPVIFLNNGKPKTRQIFTLFHELGHFLLSKGGVCFRDNVEHEWRGAHRQEEAFCNAFAGELLVPGDTLQAPAQFAEGTIKKLADAYKVSQNVVMRRFVDKKWVSKEHYARWQKERAERFAAHEAAKSGGGGDFYRTRLAYLGTKFTASAFAHYYQRKITDMQLAEYLDVKIPGLPKLETRLHAKEAR